MIGPDEFNVGRIVFSVSISTTTFKFRCRKKYKFFNEKQINNSLLMKNYFLYLTN